MGDLKLNDEQLSRIDFIVVHLNCIVKRNGTHHQYHCKFYTIFVVEVLSYVDPYLSVDSDHLFLIYT